jgi:glutamyl-tRNA reductase
VGTAGGVLSHLFQRALNSGKRVQQETGLGRGAFSIGHTAVELASRIFTLPEANVLVLGAGKMSILTARHLTASGVRVILVANRTHEKAVAMAHAIGGEAIRYDEFPDYLARTDIVISSTAAPHPIIRRDMLLPVLKKRRGRPLFIIDIAVPRDVEADVADLDNVFLYNIDHLQEVVAERFRGRAAEAQQAEQIVEIETTGFLNWYRAREAAPVIKQLRERLDDYAQKRLAIIRAGMNGVSEREWGLIETQVSSLMDEIAREPILRLKRASSDAANSESNGGSNDASANIARYDLLSAAREIFGLGEGDKIQGKTGDIKETEYTDSNKEDIE